MTDEITQGDAEDQISRVRRNLKEARVLIERAQGVLQRAYDERLKEYGEPETHDPMGVTWCTPAKPLLIAISEWLTANPKG